MSITKSDVERYLDDVFSAVNAGRYQISPRQKNQDIYMDYVFSEEDAKNIILSLTALDFSEAVQNEHPAHKEEILYIFGKDVKLLPRYGSSEETVSLYIKFNKLSNHYVIVISFHKQAYPLSYKFK
ncbi:MAG: hypothetical protein IJN92_08550 [Lachnospiraceae bacterium]|nr:hypothetical protein [Lachnospiraceae bacterium]